MYQDGQYVYDITSMHIHVTTVAVEEQEVLNIMSGCQYSCLSYQACKLHFFCSELYQHLWHVWLYHISLHYLINSAIFRGKKNYCK